MSNETAGKNADSKENNPKSILKSTKANVSDNPKEKPNKKTNKVQFNEEKNQYLNSDYHILIPADLDEFDEVGCDCDECYYSGQYEAGLYDDCDSWDSVEYSQYDYCSSFRGRSSHDIVPEAPAIISPPNGYKDSFSFPPQRVALSASTVEQDTGLFRVGDWRNVEGRSTFGNVVPPAPQMVSTFKPVPANPKTESTSRPVAKNLILEDAKLINPKSVEYETSRSNSEYGGRPPAENIYANLGNIMCPVKPNSAVRQLFPDKVVPASSIPSHNRQNYAAEGHSRAFSCGDIQFLRGTGGDLPGMRGTGGDSQGMRGTGGDLPGMRGTGGDLPGIRGTGGDLPGMRGTGGDLQSMYGTGGYSKNLLWTSSDIQSMIGTRGEVRGSSGSGSLMSDDEDVPQTDLLRKTIERSTLRRNLGRRAEGKLHPKPAGLSLEERIKQLTCYVDEDETNENLENKAGVGGNVNKEGCPEVATSEAGTSKSGLEATVKSEEKLAIKVLEAECKKSKGDKASTSGYKKFTNFFSRNKCENAKRNEEAKKLFQSKLKEEMDEKKNAKLKCNTQNAPRDAAEKSDSKKEIAIKSRNAAEKGDAKKENAIKTRDTAEKSDAKKENSTSKGDMAADDDQSDYGFFNRPPVLSVQPNVHLLQQMQMQLEQPSRGMAAVENQNRYATTQHMFIPPVNPASAIPADIRSDRVFCRVHELEIGTSAVTAVVPGREEIFSVPYAGQVKVLVGQNGYPSQVYNHFHARNDILVTENGHLYHTLPAKGQSSAAKFGYNTISYRVPQPTLSHCMDQALGWAQAQSSQASTSEAGSSRSEESTQKKTQK